jgi:hypothetical protein
MLTKHLTAEPEDSTLLTPKPAIGHDLEPASSTSHYHNLFISISVFQAAAFQEVCMHF